MEGDCSLCNIVGLNSIFVRSVLVLDVHGWCSYGPNCVNGTHQGPVKAYGCPEAQWNFGACWKHRFFSLKIHFGLVYFVPLK